MTLSINTKNPSQAEVGLKNDHQLIDSLTEVNQFGSQILLPLIEKLLKKNNLAFKDLTQIEVETGPGSYTGVRVGVTVANALGFSLKIPVNNKKTETEIVYSDKSHL